MALLVRLLETETCRPHKGAATILKAAACRVAGKCAGDPTLAAAAVTKLCLGQTSCKVPADINILNGKKDPCYGVAKSSYVALRCSVAAPPPPAPAPPSLLRPCAMEVSDQARFQTRLADPVDQPLLQSSSNRQLGQKLWHIESMFHRTEAQQYVASVAG